MLITISCNVHGQNLTFGELIKIRSLSFEEINEYVSAKNWRFNSVDEEAYDTKKITWTYGYKSSYEKKAKAWITYYTFDNKPNILVYQTSDIKVINSIKLNLRELKYVKTKSYTNNNRINSIYENLNYKVLIETLSQEAVNELNDDLMNNIYVVTIQKKTTPKKPITQLEINRLQARQAKLDSIEQQRWMDSMIVVAENKLEKNRIHTTGFASLRDKPSDYYGVIVSVPANSVIEILDENFGEYYKVRYENYIGYLKKSVIEKPTENTVQMNLKKIKDPKAIQKMNIAIGMTPDEIQLLKDSGMAYNKIKRFDKSIVCFETYISKTNKIIPADYYLLGMASYFGKSLPKADSAFAKLIEVKPDYADGYYWRGNVQASLDSEAKDTLGLSSYITYVSMVEATPEKYKKNLIVSYDYLAKYYIKQEKDTIAKGYLEKIIALDPNNKEAKEYLKSLVGK